ncbi:bifunctional ornithine acetyltransferase/N-acetylglutamate synthase, partial [Desulfocurvibacter africanus]
FGRDANWGRIVAAVGRSGAEFNPDHVAMAIGGITIFEGGAPKVGDIDGLLAAHMDQRDISIEVSLGDGPGEYTLLASDLTVEYIKINADYRT